MSDTNLRRLLQATQMLRTWHDQQNTQKLNVWLSILEDIVVDITAEK